MNRGLLVGINAYPLFPLKGCVNDVTDLFNFVVDNCGFSKSDIRLLKDAKATKDAIVKGLGRLLNGLRAGDRILFHYSGHGVLMPQFNRLREVIRVHHAICPVDFNWRAAHAITDTDFKGMFGSVPEGVEFVWVSDSCFSGKLIKGMLPSNARPKSIPPPADIEWTLQVAREKGILPMGFKGAVTNLNVALMAACKDYQWSSDATFDDRPNGAFTFFLIRELGAFGGLKEPLAKITSTVCAALAKAGYKQVPQLKGAASIKARGFLAL
jgi:hypothetical protein